MLTAKLAKVEEPFDFDENTLEAVSRSRRIAGTLARSGAGQSWYHFRR